MKDRPFTKLISSALPIVLILNELVRGTIYEMKVLLVY